MPYTVTGYMSPPDVGARTASCPTAATALTLATEYLTSGMRNVEVRDELGTTYSREDFDKLAERRADPYEAGVAERLSAL